jgi:hypothetical protein
MIEVLSSSFRQYPERLHDVPVVQDLFQQVHFDFAGFFILLPSPAYQPRFENAMTPSSAGI